MLATVDKKAHKKPVNLSVDEELLLQAKALNINLSRKFEEMLADLLAEERRRQWLDENREAIEDYNARIVRQGAFSDGLRRF